MCSRPTKCTYAGTCITSRAATCQVNERACNRHCVNDTVPGKASAFCEYSDGVMVKMSRVKNGPVHSQEHALSLSKKRDCITGVICTNSSQTSMHTKIGVTSVGTVRKRKVRVCPTPPKKSTPRSSPKLHGIARGTCQ